eukprot:3935597-Rhodomonas_salina.1
MPLGASPHLSTMQEATRRSTAQYCLRYSVHAGAYYGTVLGIQYTQEHITVQSWVFSTGRSISQYCLGNGVRVGA